MTMNPPPDYRLRVTPWARGISLRVTVAGALEVVAPRRYSPRTITRILMREAAWIQEAQAAAAPRLARASRDLITHRRRALDSHDAAHGRPWCSCAPG